MMWEQSHQSQNVMHRARSGLNFTVASPQEHQCFQKMRKSMTFYANSMEIYGISIWKAAWTFVELFARTIVNLAMWTRNSDTNSYNPNSYSIDFMTVLFHDLDGFQFRWYNIKEIDFAFAIWIRPISNHLNWKSPKTSFILDGWTSKDLMPHSLSR